MNYIWRIVVIMMILSSSGKLLRSNVTVPGTTPDFGNSSLVTTHGAIPSYGWHPWQQEAIIYADGKSFVFWLDQQGSTWTERGRYYDHTLETWSAEVNIASAHAQDTHNYPSILIDQSGYFHIFYGAHTTPFYYKKSTNPYDISAWGSEVELPRGTYPRPIIDSSGNIYLFFRGSSGAANSGRYLSFVKSADGGATWGSQVNIADIGDDLGYVYGGQVDIGSDDVIHLSWSWMDDKTDSLASTFHDICYAKSDDGGTTWKQADGTAYTLPVTQATAEKIATGSYMLSMTTVMYDADDTPRVLYEVTDPSVWWTENDLHIAYYDGTWHDDVVGGANKEHDQAMNLLVDGDAFYLFAVKIVAGVREVGYYKSLDAGATWGVFVQITSNSSEDNINIVRKPNVNGGFEVAWANSSGNLYHAFGPLDTVTVNGLLAGG